MHKAYPIINPTNKPFVSNGRFICTSGERYFPGGDLVFPLEEPSSIRSGEYRTEFGPVFASTAQYYRCDGVGLRGAVQRATCKREPLRVGLHEQLRENQEHIHEALRDLLPDWMAFIQSNIKVRFDAIIDPEQHFLDWINTGPKKILKRSAMADLSFNARVFHDTYVKIVDYKCKSNEYLPMDKYLRAVGDLTTPGSLMAGYIMGIVKEAYEVPYITCGGRIRFIKSPDLATLRDVFSNLISPPGKFEYVFFSDDSCVSVRCRDGVFMANMDIKACDGSNFNPIFEIMRTCMSVDSRFNFAVDGALAQLALPMKIKDPKSKAKVVLQPQGMFLYSGSCLTTTTNNTASSCIGLSIASLMSDELNMADCPALLVRAASAVGFLVTIDHAVTYHKLQFLKHSPARSDDGCIQAILNLGVWIRGDGSCIGDLPGTTKEGILSRATKYRSEVFRGRCHAGDHSVSEAFRSHIVEKNDFRIQSSWIEQNVTGQQLGSVSLNELADRYSCTVADLEELCYYIRIAGPETIISLPVVDRILELDYGYTPIERG